MKFLWPMLSSIHQLKERLLPRPFERIAIRNRKGLIGAEIGVFEGEHARLLLCNVDIEKLYLVDPYHGYNDYDVKRLSEASKVARQKLSQWGGKCQWIYQASKSAASELPDLDFAYIDAAHDAASVRSDIATWWPKIKPGGVMGGHDFNNGTFPEHGGVIEAVVEFVTANSLKLNVELSDWWVMKEKAPAA